MSFETASEVASFNALRVFEPSFLIATAGVYRGTANGPHLVKVVQPRRP
jgi:hypothetical protein